MDKACFTCAQVAAERIDVQASFTFRNGLMLMPGFYTGMLLQELNLIRDPDKPSTNHVPHGGLKPSNSDFCTPLCTYTQRSKGQDHKAATQICSTEIECSKETTSVFRQPLQHTPAATQDQIIPSQAEKHGKS